MSTRRRTYYARGKLLLSGEYAVLEGALALALPVQFGQELEVLQGDQSGQPFLTWKSFSMSGIWFEGTLDTAGFTWEEHSDEQTARFLSILLDAARQLNPEFLSQNNKLEVRTRVDFDLSWGLGSSSSLITNIGRWAEVDPFQLNRMVSRGSGYDIACAMSDGPVLYRLTGEGPHIKAAGFRPGFKDRLYFLPLGHKQSTEKSISRHAGKLNKAGEVVRRISEISEQMVNVKDLVDFVELVEEHERILSEALQMDTIKNTLFEDFTGTVKSLGSWGGDCVMLIWNHSREKLEQYLDGKKLHPLFSFDEMVWYHQMGNQ